jgi:hypothetical protein
MVVLFAADGRADIGDAWAASIRPAWDRSLLA